MSDGSENALMDRWMRWWLSSPKRAYVHCQRYYCRTDGQPHVWTDDMNAFDDLVAATGAKVTGQRQYPGNMTPMGDVVVCARGCGMRMLVNEPDR